MSFWHVVSLVVKLCVSPVAVPQERLQMESVAVSAELDADVPMLLRIPVKLVERSVNRNFDHDALVDQVILGTRSIGTTHCSGQVTCVMEENAVGVSILCTIAGSVESKTCGTNGPAIIHSTSLTQYAALKRLTFDGKLFGSCPATVQSCTKVTIQGVASSLPRVRGLLVKSVASARAQESLPQVEAIVRQQTEAELCQRIDADFELRIADLNSQFATRLSILRFIPGVHQRLKLRSRPDGIVLALSPSPVQALESQELQTTIGDSVEVWLHRNEHLVAGESLTSLLFKKAPLWLSSYLSETPLFSKPDERKWEIAVSEKWVVLKLH